MFPFDIEDEVIEEVETPVQADYEIDFSTGELTGKIINGLEAVKQWVQMAFSVDRYYYPQYSWEYGAELHTLIGKGYKKDYVESEVKRMVEETVMMNEAITGVSNLKIEYTGDTISASFCIETIYGGIEINVQ